MRQIMVDVPNGGLSSVAPTALQTYQNTTMGLMEHAKKELPNKELRAYLWMSMLRFKHELEALDD